MHILNYIEEELRSHNFRFHRETGWFALGIDMRAWINPDFNGLVVVMRLRNCDAVRTLYPSSLTKHQVRDRMRDQIVQCVESEKERLLAGLGCR